MKALKIDLMQSLWNPKLKYLFLEILINDFMETIAIPAEYNWLKLNEMKLINSKFN